MQMLGDKNSNEDTMMRHLIESMPMDEFEGRSSLEMRYLVFDPFCDNSPLSFINQSDNKVFNNSPFFCLVTDLMCQILQAGTVKLTTKGYLPPAMVKSLFDKQYIVELIYPDKIGKQVREDESMGVTCARIIADAAGLVKFRKGQASLTKKGQKLLEAENKSDLFLEIFSTFAIKFNWAFNDGFGDNSIGQYGFAYTLDVLNKYGNEFRPTIFYAEKYVMAFKNYLSVDDVLREKRLFEEIGRCFTVRSMYRFLIWFGLVETEKDIDWSFLREISVRKSELFTCLFRFD